MEEGERDARLTGLGVPVEWTASACRITTTATSATTFTTGIAG